MSPLECAGWVFVARSALGLKIGDAIALRALALNPGRFLSYDQLDGCSQEYDHTRRGRLPVNRRLPTRMARIRGALVDLGFPACAVENQKGTGYAMSVHHAKRLNSLIASLAGSQSAPYAAILSNPTGRETP